VVNELGNEASSTGQLAKAVELLDRDTELLQDLVKQQRSDLVAAVDRNRCGTTVLVDPAFVTAVLRAFSKPSFAATRRNSSARALGMDNFGGVGWQRHPSLSVLGRDHLEDI
jgi:hypothetical protein